MAFNLLMKSQNTATEKNRITMEISTLGFLLSRYYYIQNTEVFLELLYICEWQQMPKPLHWPLFEAKKLLGTLILQKNYILQQS